MSTLANSDFKMKFSHTIKDSIAATTLLQSHAYSEPCQISKLQLFAKTEEMCKEDFNHVIKTHLTFNIKQFIYHMYLWYLCYLIEEKISFLRVFYFYQNKTI